MRMVIRTSFQTKKNWNSQKVKRLRMTSAGAKSRRSQMRIGSS